MNVTFTDTQAMTIAEIVMQYVPEDWQTVFLVCETNWEFTRVSSWATTLAESRHDFQLDAKDCDVVEEVFNAFWELCHRSWDVATFSLDVNGEFFFFYE